MKRTVYAGTYTSNQSRGIYRFTYDDGRFSDVELFAEIKAPKYIAVKGDRLVCVNEFDHKRGGVTLFNDKGEVLDGLAYEGCTSCFVTWVDDTVYTANYHEGTFSALRVNDDRLELIGTVHIQNGGGCHQVLVRGEDILVPSLFLDRVMIFDLALNRLGSIRFTQGTGPRHGVFTKDGEYLYLISELSNELFVIKSGSWEITASLPVLENGETHARDSAAVRLSEDEKHVYVSTRTKDVISLIDLEDHKPYLKQVIACGGRHPRDFILLDGHLLCANRFSNDITLFGINDDGTLFEKEERAEIPEVVSLAVKE